MLETSQLLLGVDDAGRGPVIGPMCLAGVLIRKETEEEMVEDGAKDSKLLTPKRREEIVKLIKEKALAYSFELVTPIEIDTGFGEGLNLNKVEALMAAKIINDLTQSLSDEQKSNLKIILDCPSINTNGWKEQLMHYIREKSFAKIIHCEHKADFYHPVVSAASIIAKTTRDAEIEKIKKQIGIDFGSGYPSDPSTKAFLEKNANNPKFKGIFRESWSTWKEASQGTSNKFEDSLIRRKQKNLAEF